MVALALQRRVPEVRGGLIADTYFCYNRFTV
ncbi:hypothetical protein Corgl_0958 [Coriobacterium glomerans PW2]|uniref:Uncharacterized protein n=1 Tax=Coriobacterium glomerans (strain ATCC 49209 / DSM 20642 / JCM 10262 / PW2) TaxID=700015 RepID=F2N7V7_CORGP|nr:hypothetical protein Corgl_0958 [Coriobacterium glomerans PW2]